jgi:cephalosporin hydroxylase
MTEPERFIAEVAANIKGLKADRDLLSLSQVMLREMSRHKYAYNYRWMGRPIIQFPQDILAMQEIIWQVKPDLILETGIAHGGSLIFSASMLELIGGDGQVLGVDIDIRPHNRVEIERHPLSKRITLIEGSSTDEGIAQEVRRLASEKQRVLVHLDSNHTHAHVLRELELYSPLVRPGSYVVVFDTFIEDMPENFFSDRPWSKGNSPKTAVWQFLKTNNRFVIDKEIEDKLLITALPDGILKCIKE